METKEYERPDSQQLLRKLQMEEEEKRKKTRGKLKIFLGYAAGSGKTYAMLMSAHEAKKHKIDYVACKRSSRARFNKLEFKMLHIRYTF